MAAADVTATAFTVTASRRSPEWVERGLAFLGVGFPAANHSGDRFANGVPKLADNPNLFDLTSGWNGAMPRNGHDSNLRQRQCSSVDQIRCERRQDKRTTLTIAASNPLIDAGSYRSRPLKS